jgi:hypothetical protein
MIGLASDVYQGIITDSKYPTAQSAPPVPKITLEAGEKLDAAIKYVQDGGSITAIEAKYILTQEIRNLLTQTK